jgi:arylformamidase
MLRILDISLSLDAATVIWPGLAGVSLEPAERMDRGDAVNVTNLSFCAHTGTHVDAPFHHFASGAGVEAIPMAGLVGPAFVAGLTAVPSGITALDLEQAAGDCGASILLLKTANSTRKDIATRWDDSYICLEPDGAEWLRNRGFRGVGIDSLGIERYGRADGAAHKILLQAGIAIIEGLDLRLVDPGLYWLACLPLKIPGIDGAPARAILVQDPSGAFLSVWNAAGMPPERPPQ